MADRSNIRSNIANGSHEQPSANSGYDTGLRPKSLNGEDGEAIRLPALPEADLPVVRTDAPLLRIANRRPPSHRRFNNFVRTVIEKGPGAAPEGTRLTVGEAETLILGPLGTVHPGIQPFDIPFTDGVWLAQSPSGLSYRSIATKQLLLSLVPETASQLPPTTLAGFAEIIPLLTRERGVSQPINHFGTKLSGAFAQGSGRHRSIHDFVMELIDQDPEFKEIKQQGVTHADFPRCPGEMFVDQRGVATELSLEMLSQYLIALGAELAPIADPRNLEGFLRIKPLIASTNISKVTINYWGTTIAPMLQKAYKSRLPDAILDVIERHPTMKDVKEAGLDRTDFRIADHGTEGQPTLQTRQIILRGVIAIAKGLGVSPFEEEGFRRLLPNITVKAIRNTPISKFGTTAYPALASRVYDRTLPQAVIDLVYTHPAFSRIREIGLEVSDMAGSVKYHWVNSKGAPTDAARLQILRWLIGTAPEGTPLSTPLRELFKNIGPRNVGTHLNVWGTTPLSAFTTAYKFSVLNVKKDILRFVKRKQTLENLIFRAQKLEAELFPYKFESGIAPLRVEQARKFEQWGGVLLEYASLLSESINYETKVALRNNLDFGVAVFDELLIWCRSKENERELSSVQIDRIAEALLKVHQPTREGFIYALVSDAGSEVQKIGRRIFVRIRETSRVSMSEEIVSAVRLLG